jgi:hypothetical protein
MKYIVKNHFVRILLTRDCTLKWLVLWEIYNIIIYFIRRDIEKCQSLNFYTDLIIPHLDTSYFILLELVSTCIS